MKTLPGIPAFLLAILVATSVCAQTIVNGSDARASTDLSVTKILDSIDAMNETLFATRINRRIVKLHFRVSKVSRTWDAHCGGKVYWIDAVTGMVTGFYDSDLMNRVNTGLYKQSANRLLTSTTTAKAKMSELGAKFGLTGYPVLNCALLEETFDKGRKFAIYTGQFADTSGKIVATIGLDAATARLTQIRITTIGRKLLKKVT